MFIDDVCGSVGRFCFLEKRDWCSVFGSLGVVVNIGSLRDFFGSFGCEVGGFIFCGV